MSETTDCYTLCIFPLVFRPQLSGSGTSATLVSIALSTVWRTRQSWGPN